MTAERIPRKFTPQEYLQIERAAEFRSEYYDGDIVMMAGASVRHVTLTNNATIALGSQLRGKPCGTFSTDLRVRVPNVTNYVYPDVIVACPPLHFDDAHKDTLLNPRVLIEVLSPSTQAHDRGFKWARYQKIISLTDYLLIEQEQMRVEHYGRPNMEEKVWTWRAYEQPDEIIQLHSTGCTLLLRDLYERVEF